MHSRTVDQLTEREELEMLDKAVRTLPAQLQAVVDLRRRGCSYAEIAHRLQIAEVTARKYYALGVRKLRDYLSGDSD
jgi:RNA polymerase sigma factor (sigma-70 family)